MEADINDALMKDEVFGPVLPILTVKNIDEAIDIINGGEKVEVIILVQLLGQ
jgi:aldehyde dehydrogenase (NAD+)